MLPACYSKFSSNATSEIEMVYLTRERFDVRQHLLLPHRDGEGTRRVDEDAARPHHLRDGRDLLSDDWGPACQRLSDGQAKSLAHGCGDEEVRR